MGFCLLSFCLFVLCPLANSHASLALVFCGLCLRLCGRSRRGHALNVLAALLIALDLLGEEGLQEGRDDVVVVLPIPGGKLDLPRVVHPDLDSGGLLDPARHCRGGQAQGAGVRGENLVTGGSAIGAGVWSGGEAEHLPLQAALLQAAMCSSVGGHPEGDVSHIGRGVAESVDIDKETVAWYEGGELLEDL